MQHKHTKYHKKKSPLLVKMGGETKHSNTTMPQVQPVFCANGKNHDHTMDLSITVGVNVPHV